ncbi:MAG: CPBP family intramembrane metalloprotease [Candidatus Saganbacteria bacterium]|nr:CPBP family intramembrane metalloprotease [Candidatus Saganbacteria bacterium]
MADQGAAPQAVPATDSQYSLWTMILIWALATLPMTFLAFYVTPALIKYLEIPASVPPFLVFWPLMTLGLVWQFILSLIIVYREKGDIHWSTIRQRMWYVKPKDPRTGKENIRLLWWAVPFIALSFITMFIPLPDVAAKLFPFVKNLPHYNIQAVLTPEYRGAWWLLGLTLITLPFNYFLGEEFLFRGILLPKMKGVFGKWDWFFNGVFFAFYHLHKPQGVLHQAVFSGLVLSYPARKYRSNWLAVLIHGTEGLVALILVLKVILG